MSDQVTQVVEKKPVESEEFWRGRIEEAIKQEKMLHQVILDDSHDLWLHINKETTAILRGLIKHHDKVLDAGCGIGTLIDCLEQARIKADYTGVDISPDLIELAKERYPHHRYRFHVANLRQLDYSEGDFEWAVCRSIEKMIVDNVSQEAWNQILAELKVVAKRVLIIEYPDKLDEPVTMRIEE